MSSRDAFLADLQLGAVPKEYDTANNQKVKPKSHTVPELPIIYLGQAPKHGTVDKHPCYAIVAHNVGGPDEEIGEALDLTTGDPAHPKHSMPLYEWVGPDKRTLRLNGWRQGQGVGNAAQFVMYDKEFPFLVSPGDFFTGGCKKDLTLPERKFMPAKQMSFDASFWLKKKPGADSAPPPASTTGKVKSDHGHFTNGDAVILVAYKYAARPVEDRAADLMPAEANLIPRIFGLTAAEESKLWVKSSHTPQARTPVSLSLALNPPR
jgi:hypothetical protein